MGLGLEVDMGVPPCWAMSGLDPQHNEGSWDSVPPSTGLVL